MIQWSRFWVYIQNLPLKSASQRHLKPCLEQCILGFSMFQNYLEGLLNYQLWGSSQLRIF